MINMENNKMVILVLSCDGYSDLWDDFFNLRDKFWPDCPFKWYVVTETKDYYRAGVEVIKCGKELNWAGRLRKAVKTVNSTYIGVFLEDYFIKSKIDTQRVCEYLALMESDDVKFLNMDDTFHHIDGLPNKIYYKKNLIQIPKHLRYGLDTAPAIWDSDYLLERLGEDDYSAWRFERDRCDEAASEEGYKGLILCDELHTFNVSSIPVVIQGVFFPEAKIFFEKECGYKIQSPRNTMGQWAVFKYKLKVYCSNIKYGRKFMKWIGKYIFGCKFFTND